jgi:hypothetical protein
MAVSPFIAAFRSFFQLFPAAFSLFSRQGRQLPRQPGFILFFILCALIICQRAAGSNFQIVQSISK